MSAPRVTIWQATQFLSDVRDAALKLGGSKMAPEWMRVADLERRVSFSAWGDTAEVKRREVRGVAREAAKLARFYAGQGGPWCVRLSLYWRACALVLFAASRPTIGGAS